MTLSRLSLPGLLFVFLSPAMAQNAPPQVMAQSQPALAALPQSEGESAAWRGTRSV